MVNFLLAPVLTLFSVKFYRKISASKAIGFLYLGYLSLLFSIWLTLFLNARFLPIADEFVSWLSQSLPKMVLTQQGLQMDIKEPALLSHPQYGPVLFLIPTKDVPDPEDLKQAFLVVTPKNVAYRRSERGEYTIQELLPKRTQQTKWQDLTITKETVDQFWGKLKVFIAPTFFSVLLITFYIWKLIVALFYSLIGILLNRFRKNRLSYAAVLNVTLFALTPYILLQSLVWTFPGVRIPHNFLMSLAVTILYLVIGLLLAEERQPAS